VTTAPATPASTTAAPTTRLLRIAAWAVAAGILAQAALAGQALFVDGALFGLHGGLGHGVLLIAIATTILALVGRAGATAVVLSVLLVGGLLAQTGLGYVGHRTASAMASSLHIPLGVALLGLSVALATVVTVRQRP
jgi:hypothetical protein